MNNSSVNFRAFSSRLLTSSSTVKNINTTRKEVSVRPIIKAEALNGQLSERAGVGGVCSKIINSHWLRRVP